MSQWRPGGADHSPLAMISEHAVVDASAIIHPFVTIYPGVWIGPDVEVFEGAVIGRPPKVAGIVPPKEYIPTTTIGRGCVIGTNATIYSGVALESDVLIGDGVRIRENSAVGAGSVIGSNSTLQNDVRLGCRVRVVDLSHITAGVTVEDDVFWSVGVLSMNDNRDGTGLRCMHVGERAFIGGGALLLPGSDVGAGAVVAAGSVVTRPISPGETVRGVPARTWARGRSAQDMTAYLEGLDEIEGR